MKELRSDYFLFILFGAIIFSSCNVSMNLLNRKYRPGYSVNVSKRTNPILNQSKFNDETTIESPIDSAVVKNNDYVIVASSGTELFINDHQPPINPIACDTPPKKNMEDPNWSLYKPKEPDPGGHSKWKPIEPFNLASYFILLIGVIVASLIQTIGAWFVFLILLMLIAFSIISLIKIKKNPKKYSIFSIVFDWVFVSIGILMALFGLVLLFLFAAFG
jgi:hypothetical protein